MADQNLRVNIVGDSSRLNASLQSASSRLKSFSGKMKSIGGQLQTRLALPLALAGGSAVKMALGFDKSMTQIQSLVGLAADEVDQMGEAARKMALNTGKSSAEAAEALFFITSAGLRGADATDTLNASLKAAAVGLGETKTIADLATSAMNAYGVENLGASDATDILVAAVREGKLEASELAGAMGGVIPIASNMGVGFDEVGAALAAMSRTGTNAAVGATQLTAILASIKKPSAEAAQTFLDLGTSQEQVAKSLETKGLMPTLLDLNERLKATGTDASAIFPNIRALKGVLDLTGKGANDNVKIFDALSNTMGATQKAFDKTRQSASFQFQATFNAAKESLLSLGKQILVQVLPVIQKMVGFIRNLFNAFNNLEPATKKIVIGIGLFAAALPTIITLVGTLTSVVGALITPVGLVAAALAGIAYVIYKNWNEVLPVITGFYNQFVDLYNSSKILRVAIFGIGSVFKSVFIKIKSYVSNFITVFSTMWKLIKEFSSKGIKGSFGEIISEGFEKVKENTGKAGKEISDTFVDGYTNALGSKLEKKTTEQMQQSFTNAFEGVKGFVSGMSDKFKGMFPSFGVGGDSEDSEETSEADKIKQNTEEVVEAMTEREQKLEEKRLQGIANAKKFNEGLAGIMQGGLQQLAVGIGQSLGQAMSGGGSMAQKLSKMLLSTIGGMATQLGELAIGIGITLKGIKTALMSLSPVTAIAAGIALVALGAFASNAASKIGQGGGGSYTSPDSGGGGSYVKFANGGIVSGETLGLVGEYPGARSNPEVIAPLNKLQNIIGNTGGSQNVNVTGQVRVEGQDLLIAIERANETADRLF